MKVLNISTPTHGRVLVEDPAGAVSGVIVGFHGYGQNADIMLDDLNRIPGAESWRRVSVQGLHRFYTKNEQVVASWMTRQDREHAITDNIEYVNSAIAAVAGGERLVLLGFSQGASMAARAAVRGAHRAAGLVLLGGDIPPDVREQDFASWPPVLLGCGDRDEWYAAKVESDAAFLGERRVPHEVVRFAGGHEFTNEFRQRVGSWLAAADRTDTR